MDNRRFIDPKNSKGSVLEVDKELRQRMPAILEPFFNGKYAYKSIALKDPEELAWVVYGDDWHLQIDAGFNKSRGRYEVFILSHPEGEDAVRAIVGILMDNGAKWLKGVDPAPSRAEICDPKSKIKNPMFPATRLRRLRQHPVLRDLVRETSLSPRDFILPLFVRPGSGVKKEIASMPGNYQLSVDRLGDEVGAAIDLGVRAFILFGIPTAKDDIGSSAWAEEGVVQQALRALKKSHPDALLITDECFCEYTDHGHCGVLIEQGGKLDVDNDLTLPNLARQCISHARAGADMVAPSGMMDGMVAAIRHDLDGAGFSRVPIMSYAAKYASGFYGPFRDAAESPPQFGDRSTYQMDPANGDEALREVELDLAEGADIVMVKPALAYLDIICRVKNRFGVPVAAYNVSGEFAMVKAAAAKGWIDERRVALEILTSIKRAGADMILTYYALDAARWLR